MPLAVQNTEQAAQNGRAGAADEYKSSCFTSKVHYQTNGMTSLANSTLEIVNYKAF